jgi:hypothetical protein
VTAQLGEQLQIRIPNVVPRPFSHRTPSDLARERNQLRNRENEKAGYFPWKSRPKKCDV